MGNTGAAEAFMLPLGGGGVGGGEGDYICITIGYTVGITGADYMYIKRLLYASMDLSKIWTSEDPWGGAVSLHI